MQWPGQLCYYIMIWWTTYHNIRWPGACAQIQAGSQLSQQAINHQIFRSRHTSPSEQAPKLEKDGLNSSTDPHACIYIPLWNGIEQLIIISHQKTKHRPTKFKRGIPSSSMGGGCLVIWYLEAWRIALWPRSSSSSYISIQSDKRLKHTLLPAGPLCL